MRGTHLLPALLLRLFQYPDKRPHNSPKPARFWSTHCHLPKDPHDVAPWPPLYLLTIGARMIQAMAADNHRPRAHTPSACWTSVLWNCNSLNGSRRAELALASHSLRPLFIALCETKHKNDPS